MTVEGVQYADEEKIEKGKEYVSYMGGKGMLRIITGEASKGYKNKKSIQNDKKQWTSTHK